VEHLPDGAEIWCTRHTLAARGHGGVHEYAVLALHVGGPVTIEQDGIWRTAPGDLQVIPAGQPHAFVEGADGEVLGVGFCAACLRAAGMGALLRPFDAVRVGRSPVWRQASDRLRTTLELLEVECRNRDPHTALARRSLLAVALTELIRAEEPPEAPARPSLAAEALAYVEAHALEPLTPTGIARALGRSPTHLTTVVRRETGKTLGQWVLAFRMAEARRRLTETDELVDVIGERVGYPDPSHFGRVFRRVHGVSPGAWRAAVPRHAPDMLGAARQK
jgi:AraC-like DNA-binding protein